MSLERVRPARRLVIGRLALVGPCHAAFLLVEVCFTVRVRVRDSPASALDVVFQEVVHPIRTEEAEVAKLQCSKEGPDGRPQECASDAERSRGDGAQCDRGWLE